MTDTLTGLTDRACTLADRIAGDAAARIDPARSERRVDRWREVVARGDGDRFARRLALDGLHLDRAAAVAGDATWLGPRPEWAALVGETLERTAAPDLDDDRCLPGEPDRLALQELTVAFVCTARTRLTARIVVPSTIVVPGAVATLERRLLAQLSALAAPCADVEFRIWRRRHGDPLRDGIARAHGTPARALYDDWVRELRAGGLASMLAEYPVLARQLGMVALGWVDATAEFIERLRRDVETLGDVFGDQRALGPLVEIGDATSDSHRGGRRVLDCAFASGVRLIYKPKSLRTEVVYGSLLAWLNGRGADPPLRALRTLHRGDYGWVETAEHAGVVDELAARRFYRRAGMQLALLYAVGANDCHAGNLVAAGEDPVVVDAETLLHPTLLAPDTPADAEPDASQVAADLTAGSVLGVGLLPSWLIGSDGQTLDVSALGAIEPQPAGQSVARWDHAGTDLARIVRDQPLVGPWTNVVRVDGRAQRPEEYVGELSAGFADAYRIILDGRDRLLEADGPLAALEDAPVRVLFRATSLYARALDVTQQPAYLRDGADHSIELELLARPLLDGPDPAAFWELHRREQAQLEAVDVPYFAVAGAARALCGDDGRPLLRFRASAMQTARRRIRALSDDDLRLQLRLLRAALATRSTAARAEVRSDRPLPTPTAGERRDGHDAALQAALALGAELETTAIHSAGSVAWIGLTAGDEAVRWVLRPTGHDLYGGAPGIAIFLAALARATGDRRWSRLALAALSPTLTAVERDPRRIAAAFGSGGATGIGGITYALVLVAELLAHERPLRAAHAVARALPASAFERDQKLDLLAGCAGTLAALLALDRVCGGDQRAVELAHAAGRVLAAAAVRAPDGSPMWNTVGPRPLDGFAHGTAGIALALARLAARTDDAELAALAARAVCGESDRFDPVLGGWPDRRIDDGHTTMSGWCHGAAGIGLARLGLLSAPIATDLHDTVTRDLTRATTAVLAARPPHDHLCCGTAGELEFLSELGRLRDDADALRGAERRLDELTQRVLVERSPRIARPDADGEIPAPGLFHGTSGVGLCLLRGALPDLPSVLAWR